VVVLIGRGLVVGGVAVMWAFLLGLGGRFLCEEVVDL